MLTHPNIDPVAISLGPLQVHWYGLMYLLGFYGAWWLGVRRTRLKHVRWHQDEVGDLLFYIVLGVILGGRIGYTVFYNFSGFLADPLTLLRIWEGGMSFHGGLLGVWWRSSCSPARLASTSSMSPISPQYWCRSAC